VHAPILFAVTLVPFIFYFCFVCRDLGSCFFFVIISWAPPRSRFSVLGVLGRDLCSRLSFSLAPKRSRFSAFCFVRRDLCSCIFFSWANCAVSSSLARVFRCVFIQQAQHASRLEVHQLWARSHGQGSAHLRPRSQLWYRRRPWNLCKRRVRLPFLGGDGGGLVVD